jgi:phage antirepressor YoqD-like protein
VREDIFEVAAEGMTVQDLAAMLALPATEIVKFLFMKGIMVQVRLQNVVACWFGGSGGGKV